MLSTRPYIYFVVSIVSRYQSNSRSLYWLAVKHILKYLMRTRDYMLVYLSEDLIVTGFTNSRFSLIIILVGLCQSMCSPLGGRAISWKDV